MPVLVKCKHCGVKFKSNTIQAESQGSFEKIINELNVSLNREECPRCGNTSTFSDFDYFFNNLG